MNLKFYGILKPNILFKMNYNQILLRLIDRNLKNFNRDSSNLHDQILKTTKTLINRVVVCPILEIKEINFPLGISEYYQTQYPLGYKNLHFEVDNLPISNILPKEVLNLSFNFRFNQRISSFPNHLQSLFLGYEYYQNLNTLPSSLLYLIHEGRLKSDIPSHLTNLQVLVLDFSPRGFFFPKLNNLASINNDDRYRPMPMGPDIYQDLIINHKRNINLTNFNQLQYLETGPDVNVEEFPPFLKFYKGTGNLYYILPDSLETLILNNCQEDIYHLPINLRKLVLTSYGKNPHNNLNQFHNVSRTSEIVKLPPKLEHFEVEGNFNQSLESLFPTSLRHIIIKSRLFNRSLYRLKNDNSIESFLPSQLTTLEVLVNCIPSFNHLPKSLLHLSIKAEHVIEEQIILPPHLISFIFRREETMYEQMVSSFHTNNWIISDQTDNSQFDNQVIPNNQHPYSIDTLTSLYNNLINKDPIEPKNKFNIDFPSSLRYLEVDSLLNCYLLPEKLVMLRFSKIGLPRNDPNFVMMIDQLITRLPHGLYLNIIGSSETIQNFNFYITRIYLISKLSQ